MKRTIFFAYGAVCYLIFFLTFLYLIDFLGSGFIARTINQGTEGGLGISVLINTMLLLLFGVQHSVMARPGFKGWWTRIVPKPIERATYVLLSSVILILLYWQWRPITRVIWQVDGEIGRGVLLGLYYLGYLVVLYASVLIDHFDLFGLRQVFLYWRNKEYTYKRFMTPSLYKFVRHPLYVGWLMTFWFTPDMTFGRLLFAVVLTVYILFAIALEERDLETFFGEKYTEYQKRVPMLLPIPKRKQTG